MKQVNCNYCGRPAVFKQSSEHLYGGTDYGPVYECSPCKAWVGIHKNSKNNAPLGTLANSELRKARGAAHAAFDRLWKAKMRRDKCSQSEARKAAYHWLGEQLGIRNIGKNCHIAMFDLLRCQMVVKVCTNPKSNNLTTQSEQPKEANSGHER